MSTTTQAVETLRFREEFTSEERREHVTGAQRLLRALAKTTPLSARAIPAATALCIELDRPIKDRIQNDKYHEWC